MTVFHVGQKITWDRHTILHNYINLFVQECGEFVTVKTILPTPAHARALVGHDQLVILTTDPLQREFSGLWFAPVPLSGFNLDAIE